MRLMRWRSSAHEIPLISDAGRERLARLHHRHRAEVSLDREQIQAALASMLQPVIHAAVAELVAACTPEQSDAVLTTSRRYWTNERPRRPSPLYGRPSSEMAPTVHWSHRLERFAKSSQNWRPSKRFGCCSKPATRPRGRTRRASASRISRPWTLDLKPRFVVLLAARTEAIASRR